MKTYNKMESYKNKEQYYFLFLWSTFQNVLVLLSKILCVCVLDCFTGSIPQPSFQPYIYYSLVLSEVYFLLLTLEWIMWLALGSWKSQEWLHVIYKSQI